MKMQFDVNPIKQLISDRGCEPYGRVQRFIDSECIRRMSPYTPFRTGTLERSATLGTVIGAGAIKETVPYARYQYYGKLMVDSETGSSYGQKYGKKVLTEKDLEYSKANHPQAGPYWFERMKADHKDRILAGAKRIGGAR